MRKISFGLFVLVRPRLLPNHYSLILAESLTLQFLFCQLPLLLGMDTGRPENDGWCNYWWVNQRHADGHVAQDWASYHGSSPVTSRPIKAL